MYQVHGKTSQTLTAYGYRARLSAAREELTS